MEIRTLIAPGVIELRSSRGGGTPQAFVGYGAVFYRSDDAGTEYKMSDTLFERVSPTAFAEIAQQDVRGLINHDPSQLLGRTPRSMTVSVDARGLRYEIPYDANDPDHVRLLAKIQRGDITGSSFSFKIQKDRWESRGKHGIRWLERVKVYDVGPVTYPAYDATTVGVGSGQAGRCDTGDIVSNAERDRWLAHLRLREIRA